MQQLESVFHILPLKSVIPNFVVYLVCLRMAFSFIDKARGGYFENLSSHYNHQWERENTNVYIFTWNTSWASAPIAKCKGVRLSWSREFTSAALSTRRLTTSALECRAANVSHHGLGHYWFWRYTRKNRVLGIYQCFELVYSASFPCTR